MKKALLTLSAVVSLVVMSVEAVASIVGGAIDTKGNTIIAVSKATSGKLVIMGSRAADETTGGGSLFVAYHTGKIVEQRIVVRDRAGMMIKKPLSGGDKVVYFDRRGYFIGGYGLDTADIAEFQRTHREISSEVNVLRSLVVEDAEYKIDAIRNSVDVFSQRMSEDEQMDIFLAAVKMLGGEQFAKFVKEISNMAGEAGGGSLTRESEGYRMAAKGIEIISEGGNGGFDTVNPIAEGGNGGFDTVNPIAEGGNGGFDTVNPIAEGGNGGFDYNAIVQGFELDPNVPAIPDIAQHLGGLILFVIP